MSFSERYNFSFFSFLIVFLWISSGVMAQQDISATMMFDGVERTYKVHLPPAHESGEKLPLVFNLHGRGSNSFEQLLYSAINPLSNEKGFIVCAPDGIDNEWNVGWSFGGTADDVGFIDALITELSENYNVDTDRIYSCGMSNGGFLSYRLACELSDKIAAIASVTGSMLPGLEMNCDITRPFPVMQIHGTADSTVLYEGTFFGLPIEDVVSFWTSENGCDLNPEVVDIEDVDMTDGSTAQRISYTDCNGIAQVVFYKVEGGGHTWPGAFIDIGVTNQDFNATEVIWDFFDQFSLTNLTNNEEVLADAVQVEVYPNPFSDIITLSNLPDDAKSVSLLDNSGKLIYNENLSVGQSNLNIQASYLHTGIYLLEIKTGASVQTVKLFKQ